MKRHKTWIKIGVSFFLLIIGVRNSLGQKTTSYKEILKIIISEKSGGMGGLCSSVSEVNLQHGKWNVFNTEETRTLDAFLSLKHPNFSRKNVHIFVKTLNKQAVIKFISVLNMHLISFKPNILNITPYYLKGNVNTLWKSFKGLSAVQKRVFLENINQSHIDSAIMLHFSSYGTDVFSECTIRIVNKNYDTVTLQAMFEHAYMLPWIINKHDTTYNKGISQFVVSALGQDTTCNLKPLLAGADIYGDIYDFIYRRYCEALFTKLDYEQQYPEAFAMIKKYYFINSIRSGGNFAFLGLQPKVLPPNIFVDDALHIGNLDSVAHAIKLIDVLGSILKRPNFVFKTVLTSPKAGSLRFVAPGDSTTLFPNQKDDFPYLKRFKDNQVITFYYDSANAKNDYSLWYLLPNGQLVLSYFQGDNVFGIPKRTLDNYRYRGTFNLFDQKGKLMKINSYGEVE